MEKPETSRYTSLDFAEWNDSGILLLSPKFQRREVWKTPARSYFIDSLIRGIPIPPIFIRTSQSVDRRRQIREVIDGQQRLRALLDFKNGKFALSKSISDFGGLRFNELPASDRMRIDGTTFLCELFTNISDADVLEVFARVNTYSVPLNAQELRNGRYFGRFKQSAYALARIHLEFWRVYGIFTEASIARMMEVELTSELMIACMVGQQDKKKSIDSFYKEFDEEFPKRAIVEGQFCSVIDEINDCLGEVLADSEFSRAPLFYSLFSVVFHRLYGMPHISFPSPRRKRLTSPEKRNLSDTVITLSDKISAAKEGTVKKHDAEFIVACQRQTDNIKPRLVRLERLYRDAFLQP